MRVNKSIVQVAMRAGNYQSSSLVGTRKVRLVKTKQNEQHHQNKIQLGLGFFIKHVIYACPNR